MKVINTTLHAVLDYLSAIVLVACPWVLRFNESTTATAVAVFAGILIFIMSILTDYEGGSIHIIPMRVHLNIDLILGILLAASPWILGFKDEVYVPHLALGIIAIIASLFTVRTSPAQVI